MDSALGLLHADEIKAEELVKNEISYKVSDHAYERYAQRIMGYTNTVDIRKYINQNKKTIDERINKIVNYGELFYEGALRNHPLNKIFVKDNWVVIVDPNKNLVVTLYKVDFGLEVGEDGVDFNKLFLDKNKEKLAKAKEELIDYKNKTENEIDQFETYIIENEDEIKELNKRIKSLSEQNECYAKLVKDYKNNISFKEKTITNIVENMVCRKKF